MGNIRRKSSLVTSLALSALLLLLARPHTAEEVYDLPQLSTTTLSGYVDTRALWELEAPDSYATIGILNHQGKWEIGASFNVEMDMSTALQITNYSMTGGGGIETMRQIPETGGVILTCTNLQEIGNTLTFQHLKDRGGNDLPPASFSVLPNDMSWVEIGANELQLHADAVAVGEDGFDLISGGIQMWNLYDETTFAYREVTGNFDAVIRVEEQDPSSRWARAGLMVRESLDAGKPRPANPANPSQAFSRYIDIHVNPATQADGSPANNLHEMNVRAYTGGIGRPVFEEPTQNPQLQNNAAPEYPNAWVRIRRQGQGFTVYRGTNGVDWIEMATFTFPSTTAAGDPLPPLPATLYVGPHYSPENGNITNPALRTSFVGKFRDFSIESSAAPAVLTIRKEGTEVEVSWTEAGTLQTSQTLLPNSWVNLSAASPFRVTPNASPAFYRLKQ